MDVRGKVIAITGAASGIGKATAHEVATNGARTILVDRDTKLGEQCAAALQALGCDTRFIGTDIAMEVEVERLFHQIGDQHGKLDVLICCAGILQGAYTAVDVLDSATFDRVIAVNVRGTFLTVKYAVPLLRASHGVVLLLASGAGVFGASSSVAYGTSKGGVHGLGMVLEAQLARDGIRVLDICPGNVNTPMKRENVADAARSQGRDPVEAVQRAEAGMTDPAAVASVLRFLSSDAAKAVRGTIRTT